MLHNVMHVNTAITSCVSFHMWENILRFFITLSYNDVSIEPLVRSRWSGAVDSSPAPERWVRSRFRSRLCSRLRSRLRNRWNGVVIAEPLVRSWLRSRWCGAVGAKPPPEPSEQSRLRSRWCGAGSGGVDAETASEPLVRSETPITNTDTSTQMFNVKE